MFLSSDFLLFAQLINTVAISMKKYKLVLMCNYKVMMYYFPYKVKKN